MLLLMTMLMVALWFAVPSAINVVLWIAAVVILVLLIMRRRARKERELRGR